MLLCFALLAASIRAQTTLEEYNYVTKGYQIQVESGLDMKKGYTLKDLFEIPTSDFEQKAAAAKQETSSNFGGSFGQPGNTVKNLEQKLSAKGLYRAGQNAPCAIMVLVTRGNEIQKVMCIPHQDSEDSIWGTYYLSIKDDRETRLMALAAAHCAAYFAKNN